MMTMLRFIFALSVCLFVSLLVIEQPQTLRTRAAAASANVYDVRAFGATGDGKTIDTPAINKAIDAASAAGGGTVNFPAGTYLSVSIHLKSNITLYLDQGATIVAADSTPGKITYDSPEPNEWDMYQ